jgi:hypothetical protein
MVKNLMRLAAALVALFCAAACSAQQWEIGGAAGFGFYRNGTIYAPAGKATAGFRSRFVAGVVIGENRYEYLTGEVRYTYHDGDPFMAAGGIRTNLQGQSHSLHYDVLFNTRPRREKVRPYFAAGIGAKYYVVSGPENPSQPLSNIGSLKSIDELKPLFSLGGGVKIRLRPEVLLRFDFRNYITTFPKKQIQPVPFATPRGIFQQFTPMVGISYIL